MRTLPPNGLQDVSAIEMHELLSDVHEMACAPTKYIVRMNKVIFAFVVCQTMFSWHISTVGKVSHCESAAITSLDDKAK